MDGVPVNFASELPKREDGSYDRTPLNNAVGQLAKIIWEVGGFRFKLRRTHWDRLKFIYVCCQDNCHAVDSVAKGKQDHPRMERFECHSQLVFKPSLTQRTLEITMCHRHHTSYVDLHLSSDVVAFIQERTASSTPAEIYRELQVSRPARWEDATPSQVYYQWQLANSSVWRRDPDPFNSAQYLLSERPGFITDVFIDANVRALAFYISDSINTLARDSRELAMDSTFGTNNGGLSLFSVLAEVHGTGAPLAYCFVEVFKDNSKGVRRAEPGSMIGVLAQFLQKLRALGLDPAFFGTDKDLSEIFAVRQTWPNATIQLCYWHARRAIRTKLSASQETNTQNEYKPLEAQSVIPDLEICWGSMPIRRPDGNHRYGGCACPSREQFTNFNAKGRMESKSSERETVVNIFSNHFNAHPLISDHNGTYRRSEQIHRDCAREMYSWCRTRNYFRLWAYLWVNWYQPSQWALWARSANETEIPVLKTTMILESHWRKIKHDYLHRFNRPRIDLVVWILLTRSIPDSLARMHALLKQDHRRAIASWRKAFKREWKKLASRTVDDFRRYHTDPAQWSCGCPYFLNSRFLICKHIVSCYEPVTDPINFYRGIQRQRVPPFWTHPSLTLRPEYRPTEVQSSTPANGGADSDKDIDPEAVNEELVSDSEEDIDPAVNDDESASDSGDSDDEIDKFFSDMHCFVKLMENQRSKGNRPFLKRAIARSRPMQTLVKESAIVENRRTMIKTWDNQWEHPATMYLQ